MLRRSLVMIAVCWAAVASARAQSGTYGGVAGEVIDRDFASPLAGARVSVAGTGLTTTTGDDGRFRLERVPVGSQVVIVTKDGYERQVVSAVAVSTGRLTEIHVELSAEVVEMEELVVSGDDPLGGSEIGLLEVRQEAVAIQDSIGSELIGKAGVSNAADAIKLVTGTTVVGEKYATVRGLSDRYTGTTLNGVRVPSPDPRRRAVQIDLFPTGTIESVTVTKTFTPDLQGDFTGGGVDIKTKSIPEGKVLRTSVSGEYNAGSTGNDRFLTYEGGGVGAFGISGDRRDLPKLVRDTRPPRPPLARIATGPGAQTIPESETEAANALDAYTRAFDPVFGVSRGEGAPGIGASIVAGNRHDLSERTLFGWLTAWSYSRKSDFYEGGQNNSVGVTDPTQSFNVSRVRADSRGTEEVLMGLLATAELQVSDTQDYSFRLIGNHGAEDEARYQLQGGNIEEQNQSLQYVERTLISPQVAGKHAFADVVFDWQASANFTRQFEPDVRFFRNAFDPTAGTAFRVSGTNDFDLFRRIFRDIKEHNAQLAANVSFPFVSRSGADGRLRTGIYAEKGSRTYFQRSFSYSWNSLQRFPRTTSDIQAYLDNSRYGSAAPFTVAIDCANGACGPDRLWSDVFLDPERIGLATNLDTIANQILWYVNPLGTDVDYTGDQKIDAAYAMGEIPLHPRLRLIAGGRYEKTSISIDPTAPFDPQGRLLVITQNGTNRGVARVPQEEGRAKVDESDFLPAVALDWKIREAMKLRVSWSRTIARPTYRELAPVATPEYLAGDYFIGNNALKLSSVVNWDARWEWFRRPGDVLAASVFTKRITDPIEYISFAVAGISYIQPVNYESGRVKGFELEARSGLDAVWKRLRGFAVGANYTKLDSEVDVPMTERDSLAAFGLDVSKRRLLGQPDAVMNLSVTYDNDRTGTSAGLFYNRVGTILLSGAARGDVDGIPDVFQDVDDNLDFTFRQELGKGISIGFRARNLLEGESRTFYSRETGETFTKASHPTNRRFTLSLSWSR